MPTPSQLRVFGAGGMTRDHRDCIAGVIYCLLGLGWGIVIGIGLGLRIDRDRDTAIVEIMQFVDGDQIDLTAEQVWQTTPPVVRPDPGGKP